MNPNSNNAELGQLLRTNLEVGPTKNPNFRAEVWARIEANRRNPASWATWLRFNAARFTVAAVITVTIFSVGGGLIANAQAHQNREQLVRQYLASIDPHQKN